MLRLPDSWTWDFWIADTGTEYHVFFLRASRALLDPDRRHRRAGVGHAVSTDLRNWTVLPDALVAGDQPRWDDQATWTGSVLQGPDGVWRLFYTGISRADSGRVQRVGIATSTDLISWHAPEQPVLCADPRWYETADRSPDGQEFWRDPWVFADPDGDGWHMLLTARVLDAPLGERGVIGHARSRDLQTWEAEPPLSVAGTGFDQNEVPQTALVDGRPVLVFSCVANELAPPRRAPGQTGGCWYVPCESLTGPFDMTRADLLLDDRLYAWRLVRDRSGQWVALAFHNREPDGSFDGRLSDPMPVQWSPDGRLQLA